MLSSWGRAVRSFQPPSQPQRQSRRSCRYVLALGDDRVRTGGGADSVNAGSGRDRVTTGPGNDQVGLAGSARDRLDCGAGHERVLRDRADRLRRCERVRRG
jgi:hypothetical protein